MACAESYLNTIYGALLLCRPASNLCLVRSVQFLCRLSIPFRDVFIDVVLFLSNYALFFSANAFFFLADICFMLGATLDRIRSILLIISCHDCNAGQFNRLIMALQEPKSDVVNGCLLEFLLVKSALGFTVILLKLYRKPCC